MAACITLLYNKEGHLTLCRTSTCKIIVGKMHGIHSDECHFITMYCRWSYRTAFSDVHLCIIYRIMVVRLKDSASRITITTS